MKDNKEWHHQIRATHVAASSLVAAYLVACGAPTTKPAPEPYRPDPAPAATSASVAIASAAPPAASTAAIEKAPAPPRRSISPSKCKFPAAVWCNVQPFDILTRKFGPEDSICVPVDDPAQLETDQGLANVCIAAYKNFDFQHGLTAMSCVDSRDCKHGRCMANADEKIVVTRCVDERKEQHYLGAREACRPGSCITKGTVCQSGVECGYNGSLCERMSVCSGKPPSCDGATCTAEAPLCCIVDGKPGCSATCNSHVMLQGPKREILACTAASDCGPEMDCCFLASPAATGRASHCAYACDVPGFEVACSPQHNRCGSYHGAFPKGCGSAVSASFGARVCE